MKAEFELVDGKLHLNVSAETKDESLLLHYFMKEGRLLSIPSSSHGGDRYPGPNKIGIRSYNDEIVKMFDDAFNKKYPSLKDVQEKNKRKKNG